MTDYEKVYREQFDACGDPFPEFVRFFESLDGVVDVLDLGCGQGRDALMAARMGHRVLGVDSSPTGIKQMLAAARDEGLAVEGVVADLTTYEPQGQCQVVIQDRVLHMFGSDDQRRSLLERAAAVTAAGGHILIADTPKNLPLIRAFFDRREAQWSLALKRKGYLFYRREGSQR